MSASLLFALLSMQTPPAAASPLPARDSNLPAAEETARAALDSSPRHGEYVDGRSAPAGRCGRGSCTRSGRTRRGW
jgi:hypothetical protein